MPTMTDAPDAEPPPYGNPPPLPPTSPNIIPYDASKHEPQVLTFFSTLLRIDVVRSSQEFTDYPIKPFLRDFLQQLKKVNTKNMITPIDLNSPLGCIAMESDIPSGDTLTKYVDGISHPTNKNANNDNINAIRFHIRINTTLPLWQLKRSNAFFAWLKSNRIFLRTHGFTTSYDVQSAGFLGNLSPTMHRRDTMKKIIDKTTTDKGLNIEIRLVPRNIPYGKKEDKTAATAVEVLVDRASVHKVREIMIELFQTKPDEIPTDIYFVPSPTHGVMTHDLFYNHLRLHHKYTANLRSFGITNVHDLQAKLNLPQPDGTIKKTTFEQALLDSTQPATQKRLFKSIEPTKETTTEGKYLLITMADLLNDAQTFIDKALEHMAATTPDNISRITKMDGSSVTRTNRINTSNRFQSYAQALQNMIPDTIITTTPPNAWKRRNNAVLNYNDNDFPIIEDNKRHRVNETTTTDQSTHADTAGDTLTVVDLEELQSAYESKCDALQQQIEDQQKAMDNMRDQLTRQFEQQMKQLELKMDSQSTQLFKDFDQRFQMVMHKIEELVVDRNEMNIMIEDRMNQILQAITSNQSGDITPTIGNTPQRPHKTARSTPSPEPTPTPMNIDNDHQADGSLHQNPPARHAHHNYNDGTHASAGAHK